MTEDPIKIHLDGSTYVTKVNDKLVMVRERREKLHNICMDLLGEAFGKYSRPKMKDDSKKTEGENVPAQKTEAIPIQNFPAPPQFNPSANLVGSPPVQVIMGPMGSQPGIYRFGNRQLALLPLNPQGRPPNPPLMGYPYSQPPWMFPQSSNISGFNFPPMCIDPRQFVANLAPPEVTSQISVTVTKHVCAECGRLRSRKYQQENPLKPGETPTPAFCKKCQRDVTSTEESDASGRNAEKQHKRAEKHHKSKSEGDTNSSKECISSDESRKVSKSKQKKTRKKKSDDYSSIRESRAKTSHKYLRAELHGDEDYIPNRTQASLPPEKTHLRHVRSSSWSQRHTEQEPRGHTAVHQSRAGHQSQRLYRDSLAPDAAETFYHSRRPQLQFGYETNEIDRVSKQPRSNEDSASSDTTPRKAPSSEDLIISTSRTRSEEAARRRRLERGIDPEGFQREATGLSHHSEDDEVVVVTERYVYKPRHLSHVQEEDLEDHRQELPDRATTRAEKPCQQFVAEAEASNYYRNDWSGARKHDNASPEWVCPRDLEGLTAPPDSQNSDTSSDSRYQAARNNIPFLPRASSPPRSLHRGGIRSHTDLPLRDTPYPPSEDENAQSLRNEKYAPTPARNQEVTTRERSRNAYKPPYVREATDMEIQRAFMPSPKHTYERLFYPDTSDSEKKKKEGNRAC